MQQVDSLGRAIQTIQSADYLSENQKRDIFYNNAARQRPIRLRIELDPYTGHWYWLAISGMSIA